MSIGIYQGSTPLDLSGQGIAEVYVGATKVWPTAGAAVEHIGDASHTKTSGDVIVDLPVGSIAVESA